nr:hypothetical protein Iba_chr10fCG4370 [Ipomoea batatas]
MAEAEGEPREGKVSRRRRQWRNEEGGSGQSSYGWEVATAVEGGGVAAMVEDEGVAAVVDD